MGVAHTWHFLWRYLQNPRSVGGIAPSSRALAAALSEPFRRADGAVKVLEVGAGTGAITRYLGFHLKPGDQLDVCEADPKFVEILERDVLARPPLSAAVAKGQVRLLRDPVQQLDERGAYDFVIACLPFTAFMPEDVEEVFTVVRGALRPGGVLSYFEYAACRRLSRVFSVGKNRRRIREVSTFLNQNIRQYQLARRTVFQNFPPAHARHLRFDLPSAANEGPGA